MRVNELRIGNWVKIKDEIFEDGWETGYDIYKTNEFQITGFNDGSSMKGCKVICFYEIPNKMLGGFIHSGCRDLDIDPIQLTEEWLFKFGFEWKGLGGKFLTIFTPCGKALVYIGDNFFIFSNVTIETPIKYVHQLQNLYFALTGEELTFKSE
jgi:hypothetical protein